MTRQFRLLAGVATLFVGLWFLSTAAAAPPTLPKETYKKAAEADLATLRKYIDICAEDAKEAKRFGPTTRALAMMLALYGEASGDMTLKADALKIASVLGKKDWKEAGNLAKNLGLKAGSAPLKSGDLHNLHNFALDEVMSPYRGGTLGGMNIEKDIRSIRDGKIPVDPAAVEVLAARAAVLNSFAVHFPNDKAMVNKQKTDKWKQLSKDSLELSQKLAAEAGKGKGANEKEIVKIIKALDAKCLDCHKEFRDD